MRLQALKVALYSTNFSSREKASDCHTRLVLQAINALFRCLLRPKNITSQDKVGQAYQLKYDRASAGLILFRLKVGALQIHKFVINMVGIYFKIKYFINQNGQSIKNFTELISYQFPNEILELLIKLCLKYVLKSSLICILSQ